MTTALLWPLAHNSDPAPFVAFKAWFDFLFAAGYAPLGLGFIAIAAADWLSPSPLLPRSVAALGFAIGAAAAISGLFYLADLVHLPLVIGLTVIFACVILAALASGSCGTRRPRECKAALRRSRESGGIVLKLDLELLDLLLLHERAFAPFPHGRPVPNSIGIGLELAVELDACRCGSGSRPARTSRPPCRSCRTDKGRHRPRGIRARLP